MSSELLPDWLNLFLDDFESTLCFIIPLVMVMCTTHLVYNQLFDIGVTAYQTMTKANGTDGTNLPVDLVNRIKGMLGFANTGSDCPDGCFNAAPAISAEMRPPDEEWDYCEEDYD